MVISKVRYLVYVQSIPVARGSRVPTTQSENLELAPPVAATHTYTILVDVDMICI